VFGVRLIRVDVRWCCNAVSTKTISEPPGAVYFFRNGAARFPAALALSPRLFWAGLISPVVRGVLLEILRDGRQYVDPRLTLPHGLPVRVSTHFSLSQRRRLAPFSDFFEMPLERLHLAIAWLARADGNTLYLRLTFL
jgi:hypothetical protein